jgi:hypothetical protein
MMTSHTWMDDNERRCPCCGSVHRPTDIDPTWLLG